MKKLKPFLVILAVPIVFFIASLVTLKDYGISWDEPIHFTRGQAYLNYLLTGEVHYKNITGQRSYFQNGSEDASYFLQFDSGHPPLNDLSAALSNYIFYQNLNLLGDIESYHLFNVVVSSLAVLTVALFAYETLGLFGSVVASLVIATYPLFFAEGHFNIKDPAETAFIVLTVWLFSKSLNGLNWKYLLASVVSAGFALATKFNVLFLPFIIVPYLLFRYGLKLKEALFKKNTRIYRTILFLSPFIVLSILFLIWPFLWQDPIGNLIKTVIYYKDIGVGPSGEVKYVVFGLVNLYPIYWIVTTTPPWVLLMSLFGLAAIFTRPLSKNKTEILWLLLMLVPIVRISLPHMSVYGGIRQIMEFIPGMALISGLGACYLIKIARNIWLNKNIIYTKAATLLILFLLSLIPIWKLHPNENVYFNFLIGGLSGAKKEELYSWGNSFGNAYWQAIRWLNVNAEKNAKLALVQGTGSNVPEIQLRSDIQFSNNYWSGIERKGEYLMELTHGQSTNFFPYAWNYINNFLEPVYEVKVDGVAIAKVWKNDLKHTKPDFQLKERLLSKFHYQTYRNNKMVAVKLDNEYRLGRFEYKFNNTVKCDKINGYLYLSKDGVNWTREQDPISAGQIPGRGNWQGEKKIVYFFPGVLSNYIGFEPSDKCAFQNGQVEIFTLEK